MATKTTQAVSLPAGKRIRLLAVTAESPIQVSTPPVRIIGAEHRHRAGFRLDR